MGWWSATILGGDGPLDYMGEIEDLMLDLNFIMNEDTGAFKKADVVKALPKVYAVMKAADDEDGIAGQVFGAFAMSYGVPMTAAMKKFVIASAKLDEWAQTNAERKSYIEDLIAKTNKYTGKRRVHLASEGLFEVLFKKLDEGSEGLINK